jgi:hypothetical protein
MAGTFGSALADAQLGAIGTVSAILERERLD